MKPDDSHVSPGALATLRATLRTLDHRGYNAYKVLTGAAYEAAGFEITVAHVQGDPFADPSRLRARAGASVASLPDQAVAAPDARRATADYLHRRLAGALSAESRPMGSGGGGRLTTPPPVQQVLTRSAVRVDERGAVELRFRAGLPARGRRIMGEAAASLLCDAVPAALGQVLPLDPAGLAALLDHVRTVEDAVALRLALESAGLVAFVGDGAVLPRRSGVDEAPLEPDRAVPFRSPASLRVEIETPHRGRLGGMGIRRGVTLIAGGGYHGKSTLLRAIERGVYDHVPGDGRERVVSVPGAAKIRAEDRRSIAGTDISNFITGLPSGADTASFHTADASGSTSQAAAIAEALEAGATCLLVDEDTSATNFMIRDARMRRLIDAADEPITPYNDRARQLLEREGVSSILVLGGSGEYFDIADAVIAMRAYLPEDVTSTAVRIADDDPNPGPDPPPWRPVRPHEAVLADRSWIADERIRVPSPRRILFGRRELDLAAVEQIVDRAQTRAIGLALLRLARDPAAARGLLVDAIGRLMEELETRGLDALEAYPTGDLAAFRPLDLAAALHRIRPRQSSADAPKKE